MNEERRRIRILHVTFNMGFGGTEQVIRQLVSNLSPDRYECEIACIDGDIGDIGKAMEQDLGIKIRSRQRAPGFDWKTILWLRQLIKNHRFDIVHCHQYSPYAYGWFAHWGTGSKVMFTEHGRFHPDQYRKKARLLNPFIARTSHKLIAISSATRDALVEYEYMPRHSIDIIFNGINPLTVDKERKEALRKQLDLLPGEHIIGTVSRLDAVKNHPLILKSTSRLLELGYRIRLLLVGDGPERQKLESLADELGLGDTVIFTGFESQPAEFLSLMDIFLLPSFTEGTSMTLLEAMSLSKPTIATRVGGTPEIVEDGKTGILMESDNLEQLTAGIKKLLDEPKLRNTLGMFAKQRFDQQFSVQNMISQYEECYEGA